MKAILRTIQRISFSQVFTTMLVLCVLGFVAYGYVITKTIFDATAYKYTAREVSDIRAEVAELESQYLSIQERLTPEFAHSLGYSEPINEMFVSLRSYRGILTRNDQEN